MHPLCKLRVGEDVEPMMGMVRIKSEVGAVSFGASETNDRILSSMGLSEVKLYQPTRFNYETVWTEHPVYLLVLPLVYASVGYAPVPLRI